MFSAKKTPPPIKNAPRAMYKISIILRFCVDKFKIKPNYRKVSLFKPYSNLSKCVSKIVFVFQYVHGGKRSFPFRQLI